MKKYKVGEYIRTHFFSGTVKQVIDGGERGWTYAGWYYLVAPKPDRHTGVSYKPHWVTAKEIFVNNIDDALWPLIPFDKALLSN